jgi:hypothetical protein
MEGYQNPRLPLSYKRECRSEPARNRRLLKFQRKLNNKYPQRRGLGFSQRKQLTKEEMVQYLPEPLKAERQEWYSNLKNRPSELRETVGRPNPSKKKKGGHVRFWSTTEWDQHEIPTAFFRQIQHEHGSGPRPTDKQLESIRFRLMSPLEKIQDKLRREGEARIKKAANAARSAFKKAKKKGVVKAPKRGGKHHKKRNHRIKPVKYTHSNGVKVELKFKYQPPRNRRSISPVRENVTPYIKRGVIFHANGVSYFHSLGGLTVPFRHHTKYWYFLRKRGEWYSSLHHPYQDDFQYTAALAV